MKPRLLCCTSLAALVLTGQFVANAAPQPVPDKLVVLTFDDAVKSHRTFVAPLLQELGFGATFFVTHKWMNDTTNFMTWEEIGELHQMGFEIGNHSWTHADFSQPRNAARLGGELYLVDRALDETKARVPRPTSFAYCGNTFGPEAVQRLAELGFRFARRGEMPEARYATLDIGATYDPKRHHPLLIPTTGDAFPNWSLEHFTNVVARATNGQIVVLQFHGVPDLAHPWVHTPPERFREYMAYLKENNFRGIAVRDLEAYVDRARLPADPLLKARQPERSLDKLAWPAAVTATRREPRYWLENMLVLHRFTFAEAASVFGWSSNEVQRQVEALQLDHEARPENTGGGPVRVLPYPGGREVRRGFLDGNRDWQRGMKASVFLPWDAASYVVVDLPEAIFSQRGLLYLAHTHVPTIWDKQNVVLDNIDWTRDADGGLRFQRTLPNRVAFGAAIRPQAGFADMELWLRNGTEEELRELRTQICVHLKGAPEFNSQTTTNKVFQSPSVAVRSMGGDRWIMTAWERCGRAWGQPLVPCVHADPVLPDCAPGETVHVRGRLWFYEGKEIAAELERARREFQGQ